MWSGSSRELFPQFQEWLEGPPKGLGVIGRPLRRSGSSREASQRSGIGRQALSEVREWLRVPSTVPGVVGRPSWLSGSGRVAYAEVLE